MSKYNIIVKKVEYFPEGNYNKESQVFYQETTDDDCVKKIAVAVNLDKSVAIAPVGAVDYHLKKALDLVTGRYLTPEQENLVRILLCRREIDDAS